MLQRFYQQKPAITQYVNWYLQQQASQVNTQIQSFTYADWSQIRDLCTLLSGFETATKMFSGDDALVSISVPIICLLEKMIFSMREHDPVDHPPSLEEASQSRVGSAMGDAEPHANPVGAEEAEGQDDVEGDEVATGHFSRGWQDVLQEGVDDIDNASEALGSHARPRPAPGSLAHMSFFMLHYLQNDPRVRMIKRTDHYWLATLLDPRYVTQVPQLFPERDDRRERLDQYKRVLVRILTERHSSVSGDSTARTSEGGRSSQPPNLECVSRSSTSAGLKDLDQLWSSFVRVQSRSTACVSAPGESLAGKMKRHVEDYFSINWEDFPEPPEPFTFWCGKLAQWPELADFALELLSCPPASVLSERVFSTAGAILTDKRIQLATENVNRLTMIKMNRDWIQRNVSIAQMQPDST